MSNIKTVIQRVALFAKSIGTGTASLPAAISNNVPILTDNDGILFSKLLATGNIELDTAALNTDSLALESQISLLVGAVNFDLVKAAGITEFSRHRANSEPRLLLSIARTASVNSIDFTNHNHRGAHFIVNVTAITAAPSIVVTIEGKDTLSDVYYPLLISPAITTVGTTILKVYPGTGAIAGGASNDMLPRTFRVSVANANANSITYSIGASLTL